MIIRLEEQPRELPYPYMLYVDNAVITAQDKQFFEGFQQVMLTF